MCADAKIAGAIGEYSSTTHSCNKRSLVCNSEQMESFPLLGALGSTVPSQEQAVSSTADREPQTLADLADEFDLKNNVSLSELSHSSAGKNQRCMGSVSMSNDPFRVVHCDDAAEYFVSEGAHDIGECTSWTEDSL